MQTTGESNFQIFDSYCSFCEGVYGGSHYFKKNPLDYEVLYVVNGHDHFKVCLADKIRFGQYDLFHRNWGELIGGGYGWHLQGKFFHLGYAIFAAYSHEIGKATCFPTKVEDYKRFLVDFRKSLYKI